MYTKIELQNKINQVQADIAQTKKSSLFDENEIKFRLIKLDKELEKLQLQQLEANEEKQV